MTAIGEILRRERDSRGITRAQVEEWTGLSRSTLQRIENGGKAADVLELAGIVAAINDLDRPGFPDVSLPAVIAEAEGAPPIRAVTSRSETP